MRTVSAAQRERFLRRLTEIAEGTAGAMGCRAVVRELPGTPMLENDDRIADICRSSAGGLLGKEKVLELPAETISEDFAYFSQLIPCCYMGLGSAEEGKAYEPLHSSRFFPGDTVLPIGAAVLAQSVFGVARALAE